MKKHICAAIVFAMASCWAGAGDLNVDGNLNVMGSLSVSGAVKGVVMPDPGDAKDAATRQYVNDAVQRAAASNHTHTVFTNNVALMGRVGVGTNAPVAMLHVTGSSRFEGPMWVLPQGDLAMGVFTNSP